MAPPARSERALMSLCFSPVWWAVAMVVSRRAVVTSAALKVNNQPNQKLKWTPVPTINQYKPDQASGPIFLFNPGPMYPVATRQDEAGYGLEYRAHII
jgi:hypothetical protein